MTNPTRRNAGQPRRSTRVGVLPGYHGWVGPGLGHTPSPGSRKTGSLLREIFIEAEDGALISPTISARNMEGTERGYLWKGSAGKWIAIPPLLRQRAHVPSHIVTSESWFHVIPHHDR